MSSRAEIIMNLFKSTVEKISGKDGNIRKKSEKNKKIAT